MANAGIGIPDDCFYGDKVRDELKSIWKKLDVIFEDLHDLEVEVSKNSVRILFWSTFGAMIGSGFMSLTVGLVVYFITKH